MEGNNPFDEWSPGTIYNHGIGEFDHDTTKRISNYAVIRTPFLIRSGLLGSILGSLGYILSVSFLKLLLTEFIKLRLMSLEGIHKTLLFREDCKIMDFPNFFGIF